MSGADNAPGVVDGYGYLLVSRKFFVSDLWTEPREYSRAEAWLDLVQLAAWADHHQLVRGQRIFVPRGNLIASERFLARRWGWSSRGKVRRFMASLMNSGRLKTGPETDREPAQITISNYDAYQLPRTSGEPKTDQQRTSNGPKRSKGSKRSNPHFYVLTTFGRRRRQRSRPAAVPSAAVRRRCLEDLR